MKTASVIAFVIVILVLLGGVFYFFNQKQAQPSVQQPASKNTAQPVAPLIPPQSNCANVPLDQQQKCLADYAINQNDVTICNNLPDASCMDIFIDKAVKNKDISLCQNDPLCMIRVINATQDASLCTAPNVPNYIRTNISLCRGNK